MLQTPTNADLALVRTWRMAYTFPVFGKRTVPYGGATYTYKWLLIIMMMILTLSLLWMVTFLSTRLYDSLPTSVLCRPVYLFMIAKSEFWFCNCAPTEPRKNCDKIIHYFLILTINIFARKTWDYTLFVTFAKRNETLV